MREELTKTLMMILNWKKPSGLHGLYKNISALYVLSTQRQDIFGIDNNIKWQSVRRLAGK